MLVIDRRLNPKGKNLNNLRRFLERRRAEFHEKMEEALGRGSVGGEITGKIKIRITETDEPVFSLDPKKGIHTYVVPGNKKHVKNDKLGKPKPMTAGSTKSSPEKQRDNEHSFEYAIDLVSYLDIIFDDVELPPIVRKKMAQLENTNSLHNAGFQTSQSTAHIHIARTGYQALARRISLRRPSLSKIEAMENNAISLQGMQAELMDRNASPEELKPIRAELEAAEKELGEAKRRAKIIPYIDEPDLRKACRAPERAPEKKTVIFCLMDVSHSMTDLMKNKALIFFILFHKMLALNNPNIETVFVQHANEAAEVKEKDFMKGRASETTTLVSPGLQKIADIIGARYSPDIYNIFVAQASDGSNVVEDGLICAKILSEKLLPICQYFCYTEATTRDAAATGETNLWKTYNALAGAGNFVMRKIDDETGPMAVFFDIFKKKDVSAPKPAANKMPLALHIA